MSDINRRDVLKVLGVAPLAAFIDLSPVSVERVTKHLAALENAE